VKVAVYKPSLPSIIQTSQTNDEKCDDMLEKKDINSAQNKLKKHTTQVSKTIEVAEIEGNATNLHF